MDLAGAEKRPTGLCTFTGMHAETRLVYTDREILQKTVEAKPKVGAIDAPLCLPPERKSIDERTNTHLRDSDRELLKMGISYYAGSNEKTNCQRHKSEERSRSSKVYGN